MIEIIKQKTSEVTRFNTIDHAFKMGADFAVNGANDKNCDFRIFLTHESTRAWEDGKKYGTCGRGK